MDIKERKIREVGNSVVITLSKEFLSSIGASTGDNVYVDEEKLKEAITKKHQENNDVDFAISKALQEYEDVFKSLVDK